MLRGAEAAGGALGNSFGATAQVIHCTLSDNLAQGGNGGQISLDMSTSEQSQTMYSESDACVGYASTMFLN